MSLADTWGLTRGREEGAAEGSDVARPGGPACWENRAIQAFSFDFLGSTCPGAPPQPSVRWNWGVQAPDRPVPPPLLPRNILELGQGRGPGRRAPRSRAGGGSSRLAAGDRGQGTGHCSRDSDPDTGVAPGSCGYRSR